MRLWMRWLRWWMHPIAQAIVKVRDGTAKVTPGYDGVYGQLVLGIDAPPAG